MKFYFISPIGRLSDHLYNTFVDPFISEGHEIVDNIEDCEWAFYDLWCGFGEYDKWVIQVILDKKIPVAVFDFFDMNNRVLWHGFNDFEAVKHESWAKYLRMFLDAGLVKAYFMRKGHQYLEYPDYVHPIECILYPDHDFPLTTSEELFSRPKDIFFVGNTSKERESICNELAKHFKCDFVLGQERLPHDEWLNRARQSRFFLTACAGGFSDERAYQLINIAPMLKLRNNQKQMYPFIDGVTCMEVSPTMTNDDMAYLKFIMNNKLALYDIYKAGAQHMRTFYTAEVRSKYILSVIQKSL